ncbi:DsbA family protein [Hymenobacter sp. HDW8]|uniref:DsbA family protein n=1 Tax=Hymenobacter sp. HDW8 TaxID=2714932 RepID=UPI001409ED68|nr:DsbA family protein [Hymenobacter sp. HDW8]QIL75770.1 DsbA family protein [Hymenobacter sp. HDW8]
MENTPDLPELLYIFDPLCGWCYGMTPVIQRVRTEMASQIQVSVLSGGMVTGDRVAPLRAKWNYIKNALQDVERAAGVRFGEAYLQLGEEGSVIQNSEPPCRALTVFRQLNTDPSRVVDFAHDIQRAHYFKGQDLNDPAIYTDLIAPYAIEVAEFERRLALPETAHATRQEFAAVERIGVQGFPTTILRVGQQGYVLARGFQPYEAFSKAVRQALQQATEEQ